MGNRPKRADTVLIDGGKVANLRVGADLTQEDLASEVVRLGWHLSRGYLPSLEGKPVARVHKRLAEALAIALGVKVSDLLARTPRRRGVVLASPLITEPPPEPETVEAKTIGQEIDTMLNEETLSQEEYDKLRQSLVSHVRQLAQLIKLAKGIDNDAR
jgi:transcriptional regulator with XRE-family HTH domain